MGAVAAYIAGVVLLPAALAAAVCAVPLHGALRQIGRAHV